MISKGNFVKRVLAVLNDIERDYAYDPSNTPRYIEELFPQAWREAVTLCPARWFVPKPIPMKQSWDVTITTDEYGRFDLPTLPDHYWKVTSQSYDEATGIARAEIHVETGQIREMNDGTGYVILPDDFLRLYRFKLREWAVAAHRAYEVDDHVAALQSNPYTRGTKQRPVVVVKPCTYYTFPPEQDGEKPDINDWGLQSGYALWYYSVAATRHVGEHDIEEATYVADLQEMPEEVGITHSCIAPLTYLTAYRVCLSMEKIEQARRLMDVALAMIPTQN